MNMEYEIRGIIVFSHLFENLKGILVHSRKLFMNQQCHIRRLLTGSKDENLNDQIL